MILDTALTDALIEEGFVRELISKIQTMRKEADFEVMDHIRLAVTGSERLSGVVGRNAEEIKSEVMADELSATLAGYTKEWGYQRRKSDPERTENITAFVWIKRISSSVLGCRYALNCYRCKNLAACHPE